MDTGGQVSPRDSGGSCELQRHPNGFCLGCDKSTSALKLCMARMGHWWFQLRRWIHRGKNQVLWLLVPKPGGISQDIRVRISVKSVSNRCTGTKINTLNKMHTNKPDITWLGYCTILSDSGAVIYQAPLLWDHYPISVEGTDMMKLIILGWLWLAHNDVAQGLGCLGLSHTTLFPSVPSVFILGLS